jgi:hypothetical protein
MLAGPVRHEGSLVLEVQPEVDQTGSLIVPLALVPVANLGYREQPSPEEAAEENGCCGAVTHKQGRYRPGTTSAASALMALGLGAESNHEYRSCYCAWG